jgi:non-canonical poly(A) RNA polymerase PAPD5/7
MKADPLIYHQEICSFVRYIKLKAEDKSKRDAIVDSMRSLITQIYPSATVAVYGSYETDLGLPQSDIDMVVFGTTMNLQEPNVAPLFELAAKILESGASESMPTVISSAKVPLIKFKEATTGVMVDISFEVKSALETTELVKNYVKRYPMLKPLTLVVKYYLKQRYLNETWTGGIGSYTLVVMILSYLQLHTRTGGRAPRAGAGEDLSTLLIGFLQFYGTQFDYLTNVVSVINGGSYLRKEDKNWVSEKAPDALSVEDPTNPSIDIAAGVYRIQDARDVFLEGFWNLTHDSPRRWPHTHSFLARLFDLGTKPEATSNTRQQIMDQYSAATLHNGLPALTMPNPDLLTLHSSPPLDPLSLVSIALPSSLPNAPSQQSPRDSTSPRAVLALPAAPASYAAPPSPSSSAAPSRSSNMPKPAPQHQRRQNAGQTQNSTQTRRGPKSAPTSPQKPITPNTSLNDAVQTLSAKTYPSGSSAVSSEVKVATPPGSPNKHAQNRRKNQTPNQKSQPKSPQQTSSPRSVMLDPGAPEYSPLFPPLPSKPFSPAPDNANLDSSNKPSLTNTSTSSLANAS